MNILVTGADGFIGKNLCLKLEEIGYKSILKVSRDTHQSEFDEALCKADFIFHLAGINRPKIKDDFIEGNIAFTQKLIDSLVTKNKSIPIVFSSTIHSKSYSDYGKSKRSAEKIIEKYGFETKSKTYIYRLPNVFGKWAKPNYNSFVATFCFNIVNNKKIEVHDPDAPVELVYIDDVCDAFINDISLNEGSGYKSIKNSYHSTVGEVAKKIYKFKDTRNSLVVSNVGVGLDRALYATFLSYFNIENSTYEIVSNIDDRGAFCEFLKTESSGQLSFFTAHPGVTRGGHYHHTKNEKFLVLKGRAMFRFENVVSGKKYEIKVSDQNLTVVETIPGWSHDITNIGKDEMIVMLWANEIYDQNKPDTIMRILKWKI